MIKNTDHCVLCEHSKKDFTTGAYCGLTNKKPKFSNACSNKEFGTVLEKKVIEFNTEIELVKHTKSKTMLHVYTFLSFAVIVLLGDYFFTIRLWEKGWMSTITLVIGGVGLGLIPFSIAPLNKYKREMSVAVDRKNDLDAILKLYNYRYDVDVKLTKSPHNTIETEVDLTINAN